MGNGGSTRSKTASCKVEPIKALECIDEASPQRRTLNGCSGSMHPGTPHGSSSGSQDPATLSHRIEQLEAVVHRQEELIRRLERTLENVQRDCPRTVSVLQYNILASYLGQNTQPWFLYGADVSSEDRKRIQALYQERDEQGKPKNEWPTYVQGILSPEAIESVERRDEDFKWATRKQRLLNEIVALDADVISLVELDQHEHFAQCLGETWDSVFHKRPRTVSHDGCGVFWRRSKFFLCDKHAFDLVDAADEQGGEKRDRSCLMVLLRWRACGSLLVVVSTHLAKNPDDRAQTAIRVRQIMQIMEGLTDFTNSTNSVDAPVILMGDLNARHFAEIRGLTRTVWQVRGSPIHKFLWCASDVSTGPTSVTKARQTRIDIVQFLSSQLEVMEVKPVPKLPPGEVIPNAKHPSDHFPVCVRFRVKDNYQQHRECARNWLECVAGVEKLHPLTEDELLVAFEFFDRDRSSKIHRHDLEEACHDLQCYFHINVQRLLLDCFPEQQISFSNFVKAYEVRLCTERLRNIGELEYAFRFFANDSSHIEFEKLESAFRDITPISFSDEEVKEMIQRLGRKEGEDLVDLHRFCEVVCQATFSKKQQRPSMCQSPRERQCGRLKTKELAVRLERMHQSFSNGNSGGHSPTMLSPTSHWSGVLQQRVGFGEDTLATARSDAPSIN